MVEYDVPTPKKKRRKKTLTPITIVAADTIGCCTSRKILRGLLDSGSTRTLLHKDAVPRAAKPKEINTKKFNTLAGQMSTNKLVHMRDLRLPEFNRCRSISEHKALIFDGPCKYDIIIGADFLTKAGLAIDYQAKEVNWFGDTIPLREPGLTTQDYVAILEESKLQYEIQEEEYEDCFARDILDAQYEAMDLDETMKKQTHLTPAQQRDLRKLLLKYPKLFDGKLGKYPHRRFHIELEKDAIPIHARPYPVARTQEEMFKRELNHLVELGVLSPAKGSEWALPSFCQPKKNGTV